MTADDRILEQINQDIDKLKVLKDRAEVAQKQGNEIEYKALLSELAEQSRAVDREIRVRFGLVEAGVSSRRLKWLALAGIFAATFTLYRGFGEFAAAIQTLIDDIGLFANKLLNLGGGFVSQAYGQMPGAVIPNTNVLPAFVYMVYMLLAVAYLGSLYAMFLSADAKQQVRGLKVFELLTPFFLGTVGGKLI